MAFFLHLCCISFAFRFDYVELSHPTGWLFSFEAYLTAI